MNNSLRVRLFPNQVNHSWWCKCTWKGCFPFFTTSRLWQPWCISPTGLLCTLLSQTRKQPSDPFVVQITPERALNGVLPWLCNSRHVKTVSDGSGNAAMLPADQTAGQIERKRSVGTLAHPSLRSGSEGNPGWPTGFDNNLSLLEFPVSRAWDTEEPGLAGQVSFLYRHTQEREIVVDSLTSGLRYRSLLTDWTRTVTRLMGVSFSFNNAPFLVH